MIYKHTAAADLHAWHTRVSNSFVWAINLLSRGERSGIFSLRLEAWAGENEPLSVNAHGILNKRCCWSLAMLIAVSIPHFHAGRRLRKAPQVRLLTTHRTRMLGQSEPTPRSIPATKLPCRKEHDPPKPKMATGRGGDVTLTSRRRHSTLWSR